MAKTEKQIERELKAKVKAFNARKKERIKALLIKMNEIESASYKKKASKTKLLNATQFKSELETIAAKSEEFKKRKKIRISDVAEWTDAVEPMLMSIIATAKQAKDDVLKAKSDAKDKRLFRRLIDKVEKTGLKAKDFLPAIKAQQNRIANLSEDLGDISKYLAK